MDPGELVAGRLSVERPLRLQGLGRIYRAHDQTDDAPVALKLWPPADPREEAFFLDHAARLAGIVHSGLPRLRTWGLTESGERYVAYEWIDGESLEERLAKGPLSVADTLVIARGLAGILAAVHEAGLVCGSLAPDKVLLPALEGPQLLPFGLELRRRSAAGPDPDRVRYLAPEQARPRQTLDPRADLFALGALLFECLAGRPAFDGDDPRAILAKVILEETPALSTLRPDLSPGLAALCAQLLAKSPDSRPPDASSVLGVLHALDGDPTHAIMLPDGGAPLEKAQKPARSSGLGADEQRLVSMVMAAGARALTGRQREEATQPGRRRSQERSSPGPSVSASGEWAGQLGQVAAVVIQHGGQLEVLADGSLVATLLGGQGLGGQGGGGRGAATDQAARAARCALAMQHLRPDVRMAVATGRGFVKDGVPLGEIIDRAARLMRNRPDHVPADPSLPVSPIRLDEVTAALLDAHFEVVADGGEFYLGSERDPSEASRTLLGRPTRCVGRDKELAYLESLYLQCASRSRAQAVLVTAPAGIGKSRLRYELMARLGRLKDAPDVWLARGDSMSAGSPFGMLAQLIRRTAELVEGDPPEVSQACLQKRVARHIGADDVLRISEFLGELCGVHFDDNGRVELQEARTDPTLMGDQMRRALEDFLAAECYDAPLVLIFEDLHWGDLPSIQFVDAALRYLARRPLFVLALARPEIHDAFPGPWEERGLVELRLEGLAPSAAEELVRSVLGPQVTAQRSARLIERAGGNTFYLEELIRAVAEGKGEALPESVMAMLQGRLEGLEGVARRTLRAASTFGQVFWAGGVAALLGDLETEEVRAWLVTLGECELISRRPESRFRGEEEFVFRHALVRDAAYGMMTANDRELGHRLAAEWLERVGEGDAMVLAEHWERGAQAARAVSWYRRAAEQALEGHDWKALLARVDRGVRCGAEGVTLGVLRLRQSEALNWRGEYAAAEKRALEAMRLLPVGCPGWCTAAGEVAMASHKIGNGTILLRVGEALLEVPAETAEGQPLGRAYVFAAAATVEALLFMGEEGLALMLLDRLQHWVDGQTEPEHSAVASLHRVQALRAMRAGDPGACAGHYGKAKTSFEKAGDRRNAAMQRMNLGYALAELGAYDQAEDELRLCIEHSERMGLLNLITMAKQNIGMVLHRRGLHDQARIALVDSIEALAAQGDKRMEGASRVYLALLLTDLGEYEAAEREAKLAAELLVVALPSRPHALAALAQARLRKGDVRGALQAAEEAMALVEELSEVEEGEALARLILAEAQAASGNWEAAEQAIRRAKERLLERVRRFADPRWRQSFLEHVAENARTLALARAWTDA